MPAVCLPACFTKDVHRCASLAAENFCLDVPGLHALLLRSADECCCGRVLSLYIQTLPCHCMVARFPRGISAPSSQDHLDTMCLLTYITLHLLFPLILHDHVFALLQRSVI